MFGTYRLILALLVLLTHIGGVEVYAGFAVWGFFMLSGFLITGVLNRRYGFTKAGLVEFGCSRALRLYPTYWLSVCIAWLLVWTLSAGLDPQSINASLAEPMTLRDRLAGVFIFGNTVAGLGRAGLALSPSAWAIEVEMLLYVLSAGWLSRAAGNTRWTVWGCLLVFPVCWLAGKWLGSHGYAELAAQLSYSFLPVALLPYAIGAWLWHHQHRFASWAPTKGRLLAAALALVALASGLNRLSVTLAYLASLPVLAVTLAMLATHQQAGKWRVVDDFLGHMSYPIYLTHWACAWLVAWAWPTAALYRVNPAGLVTFTPAGFGLVTLVTLALSGLIAGLFEAPIERHRRTLAKRLAAAILGRVPDQTPVRRG